MRYKVLCGYIRQRWDCGDTVEIEEKHTGKYGARGQTREKKRKATPEEIKKHNQWKRERDVRRLIKWNFRERDYWITLTYPKDYRPTWEEMKAAMPENWSERCEKNIKNRDEPLKVHIPSCNWIQRWQTHPHPDQS